MFAPATWAWQQLAIEGAGEGHGVGMSQDGALGLSQHGFTDAQILAHYYPGTAIGTAPLDHRRKVLEGSKVVRVPLERYVRGVVADEMPASWPLAALETQAIASRTYALTSHAGGSRFDVYADTRSQVYKGAAAETPQTNAAVAATAGQIVTYAGQPATTYFFASSGGHTEAVQNVFEGAEPTPGCRRSPTPTKAPPRTGNTPSPTPPPRPGCRACSRAPSAGSRFSAAASPPGSCSPRCSGAQATPTSAGPRSSTGSASPARGPTSASAPASTTVPEPDLSGHTEAGSSATTPPPAPRPRDDRNLGPGRLQKARHPLRRATGGASAG